MLKSIQTLALAAAVAVPTIALAQDEAATAEAPASGTAESEAGQAVSNPAPALPTGEPVPPQVTSEAFGDWTVNCQDEGAQQRCQMYQLLSDGQGNPVMEVSLFKVAGQPQVFAGGTFVAPLETLLTPQLTIAIDENLGKRYPFAFCVPTGCVSRVGLTEEDVTSFKRGNAATVTIVPAAAPDQTVDLTMSLTGFTKAFDSLP